MYILRQKLCPALAGKLTLTPCYQAYIHLQDHDKKVNRQQTRLSLSFMNPKNIAENAPTNPEFKAKLRKSAQVQLRKRMFQSYKQKILKGQVDQEKTPQPDTLWGDGPIPAHYYQNLSSVKVNQVSHSIFKDMEEYRQQLVKGYVESKIKVTNINDAKNVNELAQVAASYRLSNKMDRQKYNEIQEKLLTKFHLLSNQSLILLKYAFISPPKKCTPNFNKILNDILYESLPNLNIEDLTFLMYFNRKDLFRFHKQNLQIQVLEAAAKSFQALNLQKKIDFYFLFVQSRQPIIRPQSHNRHVNQIRNRAQQLLYHLNIDGDFSKLPQLSFIKLAYSLVRSKTNHTEHLSMQITEYVTKNLESISAKNLVLFFTYLSQIEAKKSISNLELIQQFKQKIIANWEQLTDFQKLRSLNVMLQFNLYDQAAQQLYAAMPVVADSSMLAIFCRIQMMHSSGREWELIHRLTDLDYLPLQHFQDYKRFYNYVSSTAPDWNLKALSQKLQNTQPFYSSVRLQSGSLDKTTYSQIRNFQQFSMTSRLPHSFKMGCPIKNLEFGQFCLPQYQISVDIISDVEKIRGTQQFKGSYLRKLKSLEVLGWKGLTINQEHIQGLGFPQLFQILWQLCQKHFQQQLAVIKQFQDYRAYEISQMKFKKQIASMKMRERELYEVTKQMGKIPNEYNLIQKQIAEKEKIAQILLDAQNSMKAEAEAEAQK